ncbi:TPA: cyclic lactone autoinducer peptide AgrD [Staphylococcus aureus]|uniref:AgrD protein n=1 Tax=Staphylococcus aureus TaxID=1280 RepID=Q706Z1_STAAU|nr:cyclic lactone autoinducer peptide [Staphylococcus aureus]EHO87135.1 agrD protein [Staphylococcus aureus subsp. aureus 21252]EHT67331.1 AgrD family protein [Staphylococcus aureus subsp. aureus CIG290]EVY95229.1 accessory regulator protein D [Staphylococcus aureus W56227]EVY97965.1 accessory regulator protein D [Staphylococcus aureus W56243]EVZ00227.1 accessory regulator protein D [Staphylococcus aureus W56246]
MNTLLNIFFDFITGVLKNIGSVASYSTCYFIMDEVEIPKELTQLHE